MKKTSEAEPKTVAKAVAKTAVAKTATKEPAKAATKVPLKAATKESAKETAKEPAKEEATVEAAPKVPTFTQRVNAETADAIAAWQDHQKRAEFREVKQTIFESRIQEQEDRPNPFNADAYGLVGYGGYGYPKEGLSSCCKVTIGVVITVGVLMLIAAVVVMVLYLPLSGATKAKIDNATSITINATTSR